MDVEIEPSGVSVSYLLVHFLCVCNLRSLRDVVQEGKKKMRTSFLLFHGLCMCNIFMGMTTRSLATDKERDALPGVRLIIMRRRAP